MIFSSQEDGRIFVYKDAMAMFFCTKQCDTLYLGELSVGWTIINDISPIFFSLSVGIVFWRNVSFSNLRIAKIISRWTKVFSYRVSQKKVSDKIFPRRLPNGHGLRTNRKFVAGHLVPCQRSACYFFEGMTRSSRMLHSSAESWSVVHVRREVVEEKFYQRLFSGTPCTFSCNPTRTGLFERI